MSKFSDLKPGASEAFWNKHKQNARNLLTELNQDVFSGSGEVDEDGSIYCSHGSMIGEDITSTPNCYLSARVDTKVYHFVIQLEKADSLQVVTAGGHKPSWSQLDHFGWNNVKRWNLKDPNKLIPALRDAVKFHKL